MSAMAGRALVWLRWLCRSFQPALPHLEYLGVECGNDRASPDLGGIEIVVIQRADLPTGFAQDKAAGGVIPEHLAAMQVEIESAGGRLVTIARPRQAPRSELHLAWRSGSRRRLPVAAVSERIRALGESMAEHGR